MGYHRAMQLIACPRRFLASLALGLAAAAAASAATAAAGAATTAGATVSHIAVHLSLGAQELSAGSSAELRIYEASGRVRRLALTHGEAWPRDSTRVIPLSLSEPLDPRTVLRFGIFYHAASPQTPPWEIVAAEVSLRTGADPEPRLLDTSLSGVIERQGELSTPERDKEALLCSGDADCDDGKRCNGRERCAPRDPGADARGCVKGAPVVCPVNQVCVEGSGCRGPEPLRKSLPVPADSPQAR